MPAHRALITGVSGFVGAHLAEYLVAEGWEVHGLDRLPPRTCGVMAHVADLRDVASVEQTIAAVRPSHIFHLASLIVEAPPRELCDVNVVGTMHLFAAVRAKHAGARVLLSSSSAVYGAAETLPIHEDAPLRPSTDYAATKAAQEMIALASEARGTDVVRVRPFNLVGPGQSMALVTARIAQQIVAAERDGGGIVRIGNSDTKRDYVDVRDAVRAYAAVAIRGEPGSVFNICSGRSVSIRQCADLLMKLSRVALDLQVDASLVRANDIREQVGSPARLQAATGWRPEVSLDASLAALLAHLRDQGVGEGHV